jgi:hypothetical protein
MWQAITDVPGVLVGQISHETALTGCTVLVFHEGAVGGVDIRGSATGTREIHVALHPLRLSNTSRHQRRRLLRALNCMVNISLLLRSVHSSYVSASVFL